MMMMMMISFVLASVNSAPARRHNTVGHLQSASFLST